MIDNKFSKYLLYAIGEIMLVVIGILIALQVDTWNQDRLERQEEFKYLERLKVDLAQDTLYYNKRIEDAESGIERNIKAIRLAYEKQEHLDDVVNLLQLHDFQGEHLTIQNDTYLEMTSSGSLNILKNDELKISIIALYRDAKAAATHVKEYNEFTSTVMAGVNNSIPKNKYYHWFEDIFNDPKMFDMNDVKYINDPRSHEFQLIETMLYGFITKHRLLLPYYFDLKAKSTMIINNIDQEMLSRKQ
jgi:hypothetical protein